MSNFSDIDSLNPTPVTLISAADKVAFYNTADNNTYSLTLSQLQDYVLAGGTIDPVFDDLTCATLNVTGASTLRGNVSFLADATHDIGAVASARPRNIYTSGDATIAGVVVGRGAGAIATNTVAGAGALAANTTGTANTAVGNLAMAASTTATSSTAVGYGALSVNTTGEGTALGSFTLTSNTTGTQNTAVGRAALNGATTADYNTAIGRSCMQTTTTGGNNTALGQQALFNNTTGAQNVALGQAAASVLTTGSRNTIVGQASNASAVGSIDQTVIGQGLTGKGDDTAFIGGVNGAYNEKNVTTWEVTSDERLKRDIVDNHDGLAKINAIRVRNFTYRPASEVTELPASAAIDKAGVQLGVIAQEMLPECVSETSDGVKSVSTDAVLWYLVNAVQQLSATVETLKLELGR